jgi:hypothetical protein
MFMAFEGQGEFTKVNLRWAYTVPSATCDSRYLEWRCFSIDVLLLCYSSHGGCAKLAVAALKIGMWTVSTMSAGVQHACGVCLCRHVHPCLDASMG